MVDEQTEIKWSRPTEEMLAKLDSSILQKYKLSMRDIMSNPAEYSTKPGINDTITAMEQEVDKYFGEVMATHADEQKALDSEIKRIEEIYNKLDSLIETKSKELNVPYINPMGISRETTNEETVIIYEYDDEIAALVGKLIQSSVYIADISSEYNGHPIGYWFFSGPKGRAISISPPESSLIEIQNSHDEINAALNSARSLF